MTAQPGRDTFFRTAGHGPRRALMLHCSLAHSGAWGGIARRLERQLTMTMPDLPGHGRSAPWTGDGDIAASTVAGLAGFCSGPTDLIGHSIGGVLQLQLALDRPDLCRSLVLLEPVLFAACDAAGRAEYRRQIAPVKAALARGDRAGAARGFNALFGALPWAALTDAQRREQIDRIDFVNTFAPAVEEDAGALLSPGLLEALKAPVLLLEGSESPAVVAGVHDALTRRLPQVTRIRVEGAAHMLPITHPSQVARQIAEFLSPG